MMPKFSRLVLSALAASLLALPAFAQSTDWKVDGNQSSAQIAIATRPHGSGNTVTLGAADASGALHLDNADLSKSAFQFELRPSSRVSAAAGSNAEDPAPADAQSSLIRFHSESATLTSDGQLKVTGTLTVTRVVRIVDLTANEGYSGPVEIGSRVVESSREESFILPISAADLPNPQGKPFLDLSSALKINAEDFPELYDELLSTNWPAKAEGLNCEAAPSSSEDYAGALCTGTDVQSRSIVRTATSFGEDYPGDSANSVQPANVVTLALHLHLAPQGTQLSAKNGQ